MTQWYIRPNVLCLIILRGPYLDEVENLYAWSLLTLLIAWRLWWLTVLSVERWGFYKYTRIHLTDEFMLSQHTQAIVKTYKT